MNLRLQIIDWNILAWGIYCNIQFKATERNLKFNCHFGICFECWSVQPIKCVIGDYGELLLKPGIISIFALTCFEFIYFGVFQDSSLCVALSCPRTQARMQDGLKLRALPAFPFQVLGLKTCITIAQLNFFISDILSLFW